MQFWNPWFRTEHKMYPEILNNSFTVFFHPKRNMGWQPGVGEGLFIVGFAWNPQEMMWMLYLAFSNVYQHILGNSSFKRSKFLIPLLKIIPVGRSITTVCTCVHVCPQKTLNSFPQSSSVLSPPVCKILSSQGPLLLFFPKRGLDFFRFHAFSHLLSIVWCKKPFPPLHIHS